MISKESEILHMQIRLYRMACKCWNIDNQVCADLFDRYDLDEYIEESYGIFHVQGDEANLEDLTEYARKKGALV